MVDSGRPGRPRASTALPVVLDVVHDGSEKKKIFRVLLHEITKKGVQKGLANPVPLDVHKFESQQARRILDRLVGYELSPVLWVKIRRGLSAGRVQSVALRLIVDRERAILAFVPQEYWIVSADVEGANPPPFTAVLSKIDGVKAEVKDGATANAIVDALRVAALTVGSVERKERKRHPPPPYVTGSSTSCRPTLRATRRL